MMIFLPQKKRKIFECMLFNLKSNGSWLKNNPLTVKLSLLLVSTSLDKGETANSLTNLLRLYIMNGD